VTEQPSVISGALKQPFAEQVAFFRGKLGNLVPTTAWDDLQGAAHDTGFMVAGAAKVDLLTDLAAAVDRSIAEGTSLEAFRKDFMAIANRNGWSGYTGDDSPARRAWRTRTIYATNASTSYAAGRYAQLIAGEFPFFVYKHNDSVTYPRPLHVAWDGITLPREHPFWLTHTPVNDWGCHCYLVGARSARGASRLGGDPEKQLPEGWDAIDPKTGTHPGIGKGWDYAPGASVASEVSQMAAKTRHWDYQLAKAYMQECPNRDALARAYRQLPSLADDCRRYADRIINQRTHLEIQPSRTLGLLTTEDAQRMAELKGGLDVAGYDYALDPSTVRHVKSSHGDATGEAARGQRAVVAEDYAQLPLMLNGPDGVEDGGLSNVGHPIVRVTRVIGSERFAAAFEIRKGRRMLALQSMWINQIP
jgi:hypothetical protein